MKKLIIAAMTAAIASASCTKEITSYQTDNCEIHATIEHENQTKTLLDKIFPKECDEMEIIISRLKR